MQAMSYTQAMMHYFGKKPEQTTAEFVQELKALTEQDKAEFREMLIGVGYCLT